MLIEANLVDYVETVYDYILLNFLVSYILLPRMLLPLTPDVRLEPSPPALERPNFTPSRLINLLR